MPARLVKYPTVCWQREILKHPLCSPDMRPCVYHLFAKVKEPLRGTRYNTRDELIRAIGRSIRNINQDGRVDGVRHLPNIWQKVINKLGVTILKVHEYCIPVNKSISEISHCCIYFSSNSCICPTLILVQDPVINNLVT